MFSYNFFFFSKTRNSSQLQESVSLSSVKQRFCDKFDRFIVSSFSNQPFINGYTADLTKNYLSQKNNFPDWFKKLKAIWIKNLPKDEIVVRAKFLLTYYKKYIESLPDWKLWLQKVSASTDFSDAILIPILTQTKQVKVY